jgi:hypothetical protein
MFLETLHSTEQRGKITKKFVFHSDFTYSKTKLCDLLLKNGGGPARTMKNKDGKLPIDIARMTNGTDNL